MESLFLYYFVCLDTAMCYVSSGPEVGISVDPDMAN